MREEKQLAGRSNGEKEGVSQKNGAFTLAPPARAGESEYTLP